MNLHQKELDHMPFLELNRKSIGALSFRHWKLLVMYKASYTPSVKLIIKELKRWK